MSYQKKFGAFVRFIPIWPKYDPKPPDYLDVSPAGLQAGQTYVHLNTMSGHQSAETKKILIRYVNSLHSNHCSVVVLHITKMEVQLSSVNSIMMW